MRCAGSQGGPASRDCGVSALRQCPEVLVLAAWARQKHVVAWMPRHGTDSAPRPGTNPEKSVHHDNGSRRGPRRCVDRPCPWPATVFAPLVRPRAGGLSARARQIRTAQHAARIRVSRDPSRRFVQSAPRDLPRSSGRPVHRVPSRLYRRFSQSGDVAACYGILDGEHVASYGWYTQAPTRINDELWLHFDRAYVYRYKGLTLEPYRGRRFHAISMARTLDAWRARGYRGILAYVEANNLSSLKSVYRLGYVTFGRVFILRILRRYFIFNSPGCKAFGFRVGAERRGTRLPARTLMPGSGLEPERDLSQRVLSPQRLPVSPAGRLPHPLSPSVVRSAPPPAAL